MSCCCIKNKSPFPAELISCPIALSSKRISNSALSACAGWYWKPPDGEDARFCQALILRRAEHSGKAVWHQGAAPGSISTGAGLLCPPRQTRFLSDRAVQRRFLLRPFKGGFAAFVFRPGWLCALRYSAAGSRFLWHPRRRRAYFAPHFRPEQVLSVFAAAFLRAVRALTCASKEAQKQEAWPKS